MSNYYKAENFNPHVPIDTLLEAVNQLPVNLYDFAMLSGMRNRAYGVKTLCDSDCWEREWLHQPAREDIWQKLLSIQQNLFASKRFTLIPTYHTEEMMWYPGKLLTTKFPYVSAANVRNVFTEEGVGTVNIFLQQTLTLAAAGTFVEARVDKDNVSNPLHIAMRKPRSYVNATGYDLGEQKSEIGYPYLDGTEWVFAVHSGFNVGDTLHAQDCELVYVEIDPITGHTIDEVVFMHPDQDQLMPQASRPSVVNAKWRFWFYLWVLKRPEYADMQIELSDPRPFDAFYDELRYGYYTEVHAPAIIYRADDGCCDDDPYSDNTTQKALMLPTNGEDGVVRFQLVELVDNTTTPPTYKVVCDTCSPCLETGVPYKIRYYYKTDIYHYGFYVAGVEDLRRAIVAKVAANIDVEDCVHCILKKGYIERKREEMPEIYSVPMGQPIASYQYGRRRGDQEYLNVVLNLAIKPRGVML